MDRYVKDLSYALEVLEDYHIVGLVVCFDCNWQDIGMRLVLSMNRTSQLDTTLFFELLEVIFSLKWSFHHSPTHLTLWTPRNIPCQTLHLPRVKLYLSSSIKVYIQVPITAYNFLRSTPLQVHSICFTPFEQLPVWTQCLGLQNP